jgi:hypothetical protein
MGFHIKYSNDDVETYLRDQVRGDSEVRGLEKTPARFG